MAVQPFGNAVTFLVIGAGLLAGPGVFYVKHGNQGFAKLSENVRGLEAKIRSRVTGATTIVEKPNQAGQPVPVGPVSYFSTEVVLLVVLGNIIAVALFVVLFVIKRGSPPPNYLGVLEIIIVRCENIKNVDSGKNGDYSDAFVEATVGIEALHTSTIKDSLNPEWKGADSHCLKFHVDLKDKSKSMLFLKVLDEKEHMFGKPKPIGHAEVDILKAFGEHHGQQLNKYLPLTTDNPKDKNHKEGWSEQHGTITIQGVFKPDPVKK
jgi:hypothetical protein